MGLGTVAATADLDMVDLPTRQPDFDNILAVLHNEKPSRPTLFEFFLNTPLYVRLSGEPITPGWAPETPLLNAWKRAGYDYAVPLVGFNFPRKERDRAATVSLNDGVLITDHASFDAYAWPDVDAANYGVLDQALTDLPDGMKLIVGGPGGVLENVIGLMGYDNLCYMLVDEPELVQQIVDHVGSRLVRHYEIIAPHTAVGACISNDDWGFKTQPMLSPTQMRQYIIPWHRRIVETIHAAGKPAILHSCGNLRSLMNDIIDVCKYDAKHSYEDTIMPVEEAYATYGHRIAILGGIDLDFLCRRSTAEIRERADGLLKLTANRGGYGLGSGNSIPDYTPDDHYFAMIRAALEHN